MSQYTFLLADDAILNGDLHRGHVAITKVVNNIGMDTNYLLDGTEGPLGDLSSLLQKISILLGLALVFAFSILLLGLALVLAFSILLGLTLASLLQTASIVDELLPYQHTTQSKDTFRIYSSFGLLNIDTKLLDQWEWWLFKNNNRTVIFS